MKRIALVKDITQLWTVYKPELEKNNIEVVTFDIFNSADRKRLFEENWDGFIWRAKHDPHIRNLAKRIIYLFDEELKVKTYPSWDSYWLYDDKIAQSFLLEKHKINIPKTFIFFNKEEALEFVANRKEFPIVYKSSSGAGSSNVGLLKNKFQAKQFVKKAFGKKGVETFYREDPIKRYVYFQEYLWNNTGDFRFKCYKNERIAGFFRENNKEGFASGSGKFNFDDLPEDLLAFVYNAHKKLGSKLLMSYDILKNNESEWVITEMSVVFSDLNAWSGDSPTPTYSITSDGLFKKIIDKENDHKYFIDLLLRDWGFK